LIIGGEAMKGFSFPMDMGIEGAALATAIGPVVSVIVLLPHFLLKRGRLYLKKATIRWKDWLDIWVTSTSA
jgi:Na+-driven multidrug efflux pump